MLQSLWQMCHYMHRTTNHDADLQPCYAVHGLSIFALPTATHVYIRRADAAAHGHLHPQIAQNTALAI